MIISFSSIFLNKYNRKKVIWCTNMEPNRLHSFSTELEQGDASPCGVVMGEQFPKTELHFGDHSCRRSLQIEVEFTVTIPALYHPEKEEILIRNRRLSLQTNLNVNKLHEGQETKKKGNLDLFSREFKSSPL